MQLDAWMKLAQTNANQFAPRIGVDSSALYRYMGGERIPPPEVMRRIIVATAGAVMPQDFYVDIIREAMEAPPQNDPPPPLRRRRSQTSVRRAG